MLFYTFNPVISAERIRTNMRKEKISSAITIYNLFFNKTKKNEIKTKSSRRKIADENKKSGCRRSAKQQPNERRCCYEKSQFTTETERLKNKVRRMNEHT